MTRAGLLAGLLLGAALALPCCAADLVEAGVVSRVVPDQTDWLVRTPAEEKVGYRGVVSFDGAGLGGTGMMYPAPSLIGFFAAVVTHGVISSSMQDSKKSKIQAEADKVLVLYQPTLDTITHRELLLQGLAKARRGASKKPVQAGEAIGASWVIETAPIFSVTQDERALVIDNAITIRAPDAPDAVLYQNVVRVVSQPRPPADAASPLLAFWTANEGRMLKQESADLFAQSLDAVLVELAKGPEASPAPHRTVRYLEGGLEKIERASLAEERCDRLVLKTLRGWLMSVPRQPGEALSCEAGRTAPSAQASSVKTAGDGTR